MPGLARHRYHYIICSMNILFRQCPLYIEGKISLYCSSYSHQKGRRVLHAFYNAKMSKTLLITILIPTVLIIGGLGWYFNTQQTGERTLEQKRGRVFFGVTDTTAPLEHIHSVMLTVEEVQIHGKNAGWIMISQDQKQYNLLELKEKNLIQILADVNLPEGSYDQMRILARSVVVTPKDTEPKEAQMLSKELRLPLEFQVKGGETSSIVVDYLVDKTLHITESGTYAFFPAVDLEIRSNPTVLLSGKDLAITNGKIETEQTFGMDEKGEMRLDTLIDTKAKIIVMGNILKIIPEGQSEARLKVNAQSAVDQTLQGDYLDTIYSTKLTVQEGKKAWLVAGVKDLLPSSIMIDATTGAVMAVH